MIQSVSFNEMVEKNVSGTLLVAITKDQRVDVIAEMAQPRVNHLMEPWAYTAAAIALFIIGFFGFLLNLFVIILMRKDMKLWTPMNTILFNLVCSDFSVSLLGNPFTLAASIAQHWFFGRELCIAYGFFMAQLGISSIVTLTVLSYERFCLVTCPFSSRALSQRSAKYVIAGIWLYSFGLTTPPLFGWGRYTNEAANISCSVDWKSQTLNATSYIVYLFVMGLVLPIIVILYSYVNIIIAMKQNASRLGRKNRAEGRVTWMIALMITAFTFAWLPYATVALVEQFGPSELITPGIAMLPSLVAKSSICYNPLIYVGMNTQFRASWDRIRLRDQNVVAETTMNVTQTSSRVTVNCSTFDRKKWKCRFVKTQTGQHPKPLARLCEIGEKSQVAAQKTPEFELSVIAGGKSLLMKANAFKSNMSL